MTRYTRTYIFRVVSLMGWQQTFPAKPFGQHITLTASQIAQGVSFGFIQTPVNVLSLVSLISTPASVTNLYVDLKEVAL